LQPTFSPETSVVAAPPSTAAGAAGASTTASKASTPTTASGAGATGATTTTRSGVAAPTTSPAGPTAVTIEDRQFDTTPSVLDPAPAWADLVGASLTRTAGGFELRIRSRGGAPATSGDDDHTMNVASFYDVDGDGSIDYEIWLNVASGGWGASYFDDTGGGHGGYQERSGVTVAPEGTDLVARFPLTHLAGATHFRWSLASEWGRYEVIGTDAAARDDLPDGDQPATFP
jgi:hypothetical protein